MLVQVGVAAGLIAVTIVIQALFMSAGLRTFRSIEARRPEYIASRPTPVTVTWVLFLFVPIILDVTLWATLYCLLGALPTFENALYFSMVTFTTVGYGDIVLNKDWRLLATFEAMNGWIIFGWATALIIAIVQRLYLQPDATEPEVRVAARGQRRAN
jgi:hypothetical protein